MLRSEDSYLEIRTVSLKDLAVSGNPVLDIVKKGSGKNVEMLLNLKKYVGSDFTLCRNIGWCIKLMWGR